jgi:hypothetical protein
LCGHRVGFENSGFMSGDHQNGDWLGHLSCDVWPL